jgi:hypothetical protein
MNLILRMQKEGNISDSLPQIQSHIFKFYRALFGQVGNKQASTQDNFWDDQFKIGLSDQLLLEQPFTKKNLGRLYLDLKLREPLDLMGLVSYFINIFLIWLSIIY